MYFSNGDEDDGGGFSVPPTSHTTSKLQSLFGADGHSSKGGNESLVYVPQKQPKAKGNNFKKLQKQQHQPHQGPQTADHQKNEGPTLMHACKCMTYRLVNTQYVSQGKLGVAVLGNLGAKDYKLLVYAGQKKAVTSAKVHPEFTFKVLKDNYASFNDDQSHTWAVCFESEEELIETAKQVTIGKFNMEPSKLVSQDLNQVDGQELQKGDTVELHYTGWLLDGNRIGKCFDSCDTSGNNPKFKLGRGKVIKAWEMGVLGMRKFSKRLLMVPPEMAEETRDVGPQVPPNQVLIFQVEVLRVKYANPQQDNDMGSLAGSIDMEKTNSDTDYYDAKDDLNIGSEDLPMRTKSVPEQLEKPDTVKAKLLERMSKMGQAMVPPVVSNVDDDVDSDDESVKLRTRPPPPECMDETMKPRPNDSIDNATPTLPTATQNAPMQTSLYHTQQQQHSQQQLLLQQQQQVLQQQSQELSIYKSPQLLGYQPHSVAPPPQHMSQQSHIVGQSTPSSGVSSTEMNLILTDGRLKHTELKTDLNRIVDKMDAMSAKLNNLESLSKQLQVGPLQLQGQEMEAIVIMQNITRIMKENEKFRAECDEKSKKIEHLNERMTDLLTRNQQFFEQSNQLLVTQTDSMQTTTANALVKVTHLEEQNMRLQTELAEQRSQLLEARGQKDVVMKSEGHLYATIETLTQELSLAKENADSTHQRLAESEAIIKDLQEQMKNTRVDQKHNQLSAVQLKEDIIELKAENESISKILAEVKNKRKNEKEKYEEDLQELKRHHEEDIKSLRERYKKNMGDESEKIARIEEDLSQQYEERMRMKTKSLEKSHKGALQQAEEEKELLRRDIKVTKEKMSNLDDEHGHKLRSELEILREKMSLEHSRVIKALNERNESLSTRLKEAEQQLIQQSAVDQQQQQKYSNEQQQLLQLQYNQLLEKLKDKTEEISSLKLDCDNAYDRGLTAGRATVESISKASYEKGYAEGEVAAGEFRKVSQDIIVEEIKKVMNAVFFKTKAKFESNRKYDGKHVVVMLLDTIKETTLKMTEKESDEHSEGDEDEEEEESEEEGEEIHKSGDMMKSAEVVEMVKDVSEVGAEEIVSKAVVSAENVDPNATEVEDSDHLPAEVTISHGVASENRTANISVDTDNATSNTAVDSSDLDALPPLSNDSKPFLKTEDSNVESDSMVPSKEPILETNNDAPFEGGEIDATLGSFVAIETCTVSGSSVPSVPSKVTQGESEDDEKYATDEGENDYLEETKANPVTELMNVVDVNMIDRAVNFADSITQKGSVTSEDKLSGSNAGHKLELSDDDSPVDNVLTIVTDDTITTGQSDSATEGGNDEGSRPDDMETSRNALADLGLDSSMFGVPPAEEGDDEEEEEGLFTDPRKDSLSSVDNPPPGTSHAKQPKEEGSSTRTSTKSSIFDDEDEDDDGDLFNPRGVKKHKVSPFVRSPPPLFDDDDGDVNWI